MKILLDADILLEAVLDRNMFVDKIEKLFEIFTVNKIGSTEPAMPNRL